MRKSITGGRRSAIEIVREILSACNSGGARKTAIMYGSNLSYDQLCRYLALLSSRGLIEEEDHGHFRLTTRGQRTLRQVASVVRTLGEVTQEPERAVAV